MTYRDHVIRRKIAILYLNKSHSHIVATSQKPTKKAWNIKRIKSFLSMTEKKIKVKKYTCDKTVEASRSFTNKVIFSSYILVQVVIFDVHCFSALKVPSRKGALV